MPAAQIRCQAASSIGITDSRNTEITGGELKPGDRVVVGENLGTPDTSSNSTLRMRMF